MNGRRPAKTSSSDEPLEFFKVYLPSFSSHQLLIPPDFVKHLRGVVPKKAVLKDTAGRSWPIGIAEVGNNLFIKSGWRDFVINHSLDFADFLIFRYGRDSVFLVKVFGKNGCRKEATCKVNRQLAAVKMEELADEVNQADEAEQKQRRPVRACKRKFMDLNIDRMENHGTCLLLLFCPGEIGLPPVLCMLYFRQFLTDILCSSRNKSSSEKMLASPAWRHMFMMNNPQLGIMHLQMFAESHGLFLRRNRIKLNLKEMIVRDQNGKTWSMHINVRKDGRIYPTSGWTEFGEKNNLRVGDRCVPKFVLGEGSRCSKMNLGVLPLGLKIQKNHKYFVM